MCIYNSEKSLIYLHISFFCCNFAAKLVKIFDMSKFSREKIQDFRIFYVELKKNKWKRQFRDELCQATGWAYSTFYAKMKSGNIYRTEAPIVKSIIENFRKKDEKGQ